MALPRLRTVGLLLLVVGGFGWLLFVIWLVGQHREVEIRLAFIETLESLNGRVISYEDAPAPNASSAASWARSIFEDRPIYSIELPYGFDRLRQRAELIFPEAREISVGASGPAMAKMFGGEDGLEILRLPDSVQACRLEIPNKITSSTSTIGGYQTKGDEVEIPLAVYTPLSDMLLEPDSYEWYMESMCLPEFGVRMTWRRASERIDILVCFNCSEMLIYRDSRLVRRRDIEGPLRDLLLSATKSLFPEDAAIQALKPCGSGSKPEPLPNAH